MELFIILLLFFIFIIYYSNFPAFLDQPRMTGEINPIREFVGIEVTGDITRFLCCFQNDNKTFF